MPVLEAQREQRAMQYAILGSQSVLDFVASHAAVALYTLGLGTATRGLFCASHSCAGR